MSENVGTNDASSKPIKVNKWDTNAVKNALDDACKKYFNETLNYTEFYTLMDRRLYLSFVACLFSLFALVYDWFNPFPKSRSVLIICAVGYFVLMGILTFYMQFIECGKFYTGKLVDKAGVGPESRCTIASKLKKYDDKYCLTLEYNEGKDGSMTSSGAFIRSVGNYFDESGVLHYNRIVADLKTIYDQARSNARKVK
ncbi:unnamed protein product [Adineta ricciae]|uniref:Signal peptidase complex subunit 2 n=1 Tax=Adineta ricciae TaxID=249248 RepID=A0A813UXP9_ADIRI|nr:unnamed protein product [Adineta ricciae]CAF1570911.1 unnamed protein product [Adineta ricciae]